jgi:general secretion pathway protein D
MRRSVLPPPRRWAAFVGLGLAITGCAGPLPPGSGLAPPVPSAVSSSVLPVTPTGVSIGAGLTQGRSVASFGAAPDFHLGGGVAGAMPGDVTLNFSGTDIRTVVAQILGTILQQTYTIDPAVQGTASLNTVTPLARGALIPVLQTLLAQNNAVLVRSNGIYRVMAADQAAASPGVAAGPALGGAVVVTLHAAEAAPLAAVLQPYITATTRILIAADQNALIVTGDPSSRNALVSLIQAFDVDALAGQSYQVFPVTAGDAATFAAGFAAALRGSAAPDVPGPVRVVALARINAVLVIARSAAQLADARRVYAVLNAVDRQTVRSWYVYDLHNGRANDAAFLLQQAFTPDDVTAQPTAPASGQVSTTFASQSGSGGGTAAAAAAPAAGAGQDGTQPAPPAGDRGGAANAIRIIVDNAHNALLIYATAAEDERISAMLARVDGAPAQVRIDAVIAEVDLNGALQYGTQFFFKSGGINAVLSAGSTASLAANFPGFVLSGHGADAAPLALSLLQSVTQVNVLSSPELMVLDGQSASLQVGNLVPYLTQTSQSTAATGSPVINSINYRETGVILKVTPHVGSDGLVTLDVAQEISGVQSTVTTAGVNSPTFSERAVTSRVAIQDGQTVGLAGLISDTASHQNQGVPYLKNLPVFGDLFATQNNQRGRTELLVLITPHVMRNATDEAAFTADLRAALPGAAAVPAALSALPGAAAADPDETARSPLPP